MNLFAEFLDAREAMRPLRLCVCWVDETTELMSEADAAGIVVLDMKRLVELGRVTELQVLQHVLMQLGAKPPSDLYLCVQKIAAELMQRRSRVRQTRRVLLTRVPDNLVQGLAHRLIGIGRTCDELSFSNWRGPARLLLACYPHQLHSVLPSTNESSILDFCDPPSALRQHARHALPLEVSTLDNGLGILRAALRSQVLRGNELAAVADWPPFTPNEHSRLVEELPRAILRWLVLSGAEPVAVAHRARVCIAAGASQDDLCHRRQIPRAVSLRHLAYLLLPPTVRSTNVAERNLLGESPLWRYLFCCGDKREVQSICDSDDFYDLARDSIGEWVSWLGAELIVPFDAIRLELISHDEEWLGRVQLAAAFELLYRLRLSAAHGLPRARSPWARTNDSVAAYLALSVLANLATAIGWHKESHATPVAKDVFLQYLPFLPSELVKSPVLAKLGASSAAVAKELVSAAQKKLGARLVVRAITPCE